MIDTPRKYTRRSQEEWQALISQWQQSGLSAANFCKQHHLSSASFYKWRQRFEGSDNPDNKTLATPVTPVTDFIDITALSSTADRQGWNIVLNLGDGLSLTLSHS
jgi:transposase-like protein